MTALAIIVGLALGLAVGDLHHIRRALERIAKAVEEESRRG